MSYRYCLFDLDGTLTDPGVGITNSVMHALRKFGISVPDRSELYSFIGPPLGESFRKQYGFSEEQSRQAVDYYREYFRAGGIFENTVYDGIPELLQALKRKGVTVALATSKPYEFGHVDPAAVLMIGDRAQDIAGAKANGLPSAGVLWGYGSREELQSAGTDHLLSVPSDLLSLL